ncbi:DNA polymerase III subunit delta [Breoghania sp.]|uniref:DNA polymerase III subunit delta n=1 Tax=Breoghania sp. TaxID=2065378 RepID=UPI0026017E29|nr:DNA polymerase III subunit delta [Breoghania sp.]MDJ0930523.1 DNA polymerase III subunit delta [Breoghania sp.]
MVALKAAEIDRFIANPPADMAVILVYGPDAGLVNERAKALVEIAAKGNDDPFGRVKLHASELASDPQRLVDEYLTVPLFGGKRIIWVRDAGGKNLAPAVEPVLKAESGDALVVIEACDLKKGTGLRKIAESAKNAAAVPCYADATRDLDRLIDEETRAADLTITREARAALHTLLGADRLASRGEIAKLCLYALGKGRVEADDVDAVVGDASAFALDALIDAAAGGDLATLDHGLDRLGASGLDPSVIAGQALRRFQWLQAAHAEMEAGANPDDLVKRARPMIYFKRQPMVAQQIRIWTPPRVARALEILHEATFKSRTMPQLSRALVSDTLLTLARVARSAGGRR